MQHIGRRSFLGLISTMTVAPAIQRRTYATQQPAVAAGALPEVFPRQDATVVREMVGVSHGNVARVKELVTARPALARAAWEWGYGDWETALGAASHVGNREIARILLDNGAHPTIFSAAMLGELDVVKAFIVASSGIQRTRGPHGITLLAHARAGGHAETIKYLEGLGDADPRYTNEPISAEEASALLGSYAFGSGASERLVVSKTPRDVLVIKREGDVDRNLFHQGGRVFIPAGAEAVRIAFEPKTGASSTVRVVDGPIHVTGRRT